MEQALDGLANVSQEVDTETTGISATRIVLVCVLYIPFVAVTITGNIFVLAAYHLDERIRKNTTNAFILNLAVADLLVGVIMLINTSIYVTDKWFFGRTFCIVVWAADFASTDMSVITIIAISLDRYLMVRNTLRHRSSQSRKRIAIIFVIVWILCLFVHNCIAFIYSALTNYRYLERHTCNLEYRQQKGLVVGMFLVEFVVPVVCLVLLNSQVCIHLERQGSRIKLQRRQACHAGHEPPPCNVDLGKDKASGLYVTTGIQMTSFKFISSQNQGTIIVSSDKIYLDNSSTFPTVTCDHETAVKSYDNEIRVHRRARTRPNHHKATKLLTVLLIVFVISWLPYYIYDCYVLFVAKENANEAVTQILTFILWGNSAVNPLLYAFTNVHYKQNFMKFLHLRKGLHVIHERCV